MNKKIYVLEDDEGIRDVIEILLNLESYEVQSFPTIKEFRSANHNDADLFLLDVMLPDGDGLCICRELKEASATAGIPVLLMSAHAALDVLHTDYGAVDFIFKPFNIDELLQKIKARIVIK